MRTLILSIGASALAIAVPAVAAATAKPVTKAAASTTAAASLKTKAVKKSHALHAKTGAKAGVAATTKTNG